jgi:hypothetical protein
MKKVQYEILETVVSDTGDVPRAKTIFYGCKKCGGVVPSIPGDNVSCECGNIGIDKDVNRLWIGDYESFVLLRKT